MSKEVIPLPRFQSLTNAGATGISVDAAGKIWAGCWDSSTAVRMDPNAGVLVTIARFA
jgi:sugar lactone lactonase YvrE